MKKMKHFLSILMSVVMVITSIGSDYLLSNAASGEPGPAAAQRVMVNFDAGVEAADVIDDEKPVITCEKTVDEREGAIWIRYTLTERNPDFSNFNLNVSGKNNDDPDGTTFRVLANGNSIRLEDISTWIKDPNSWRGAGTYRYTLDIKILEEGTYDFVLEVRDFTHEPVVADTGTFRYDKSAPELMDVNIVTSYDSANIDYSYFDPEKAEIEVSAFDLAGQVVSGVCVAHSTDNFYHDPKDIVEYPFSLTADPDREGLFTGKVTINANFKGELGFIFTDDEGHVSKEEIYADGYRDYGIVVEDEEMHLMASKSAISDLNSDSARNNIYNEDIKLNLFATNNYSGIESIVYSVNGKETNAELNQQEFTISGWTQNIYIPATKENEGNHVQAVLTVTDNAGRVSTVTKEYMIDITSPVISVGYDKNTSADQGYYNTRTMTVSINDYNFDPNGVTFNITRNGEPMTITPDFHTDGVKKTDKDGTPYYTYTMKVPFADAGDYKVTLSATDLAGNVSQYSKTDAFTIDKTAPEMTITYDNNSPYKGNYYKNKRTATITVKEHNFNASNVRVNVTASQNGKSIKAPAVSAFSTKGDVHTAQIVFDKDARYTISATCTDIAGNKSNSIEKQTFIIDRTNPKIEITGVKENESYTDNIKPVITVTDGNYNADGVTVSLVGGKTGTKEFTCEISDIANGQTFSCADIQPLSENDGYYVLTVTAIDQLGHKSEAAVSYRINRFGSVYTLNDGLQSAVDACYVASSDQYSIIEENVDTIDSRTLTCKINNETLELEENTDYFVKHTTNSDGWHQYEYSLSKDVFEREGIYNVAISSKDAAGNVTDNQSKDLNIEFCIDRTKPECVISGVQEGQEFEKDEEAKIVIEANDNIKFSDMQVTVNGNLVATEADMLDGKVSFSIQPTDGELKLAVVCHDAAGNEELQEVNFHFKDGGFAISWQIILLIILLVLAILIFLFFIILKRRNKKEE